MKTYSFPLVSSGLPCAKTQFTDVGLRVAFSRPKNSHLREQGRCVKIIWAKPFRSAVLALPNSPDINQRDSPLALPEGERKIPLGQDATFSRQSQSWRCVLTRWAFHNQICIQNKIQSSKASCSTLNNMNLVGSQLLPKCARQR